MSGAHPAVFLDRDGVILVNREDYVKSLSEIEFLPGALAALARLAEADLPVIIVTNQSAVGRGILTEAEAWALQNHMVEEIERHGGRIMASYLCIHRPDAGCKCRKPQPGMLRQAASEHAIDLSASFIIGDALSDLEAGEAVGAYGLLVLTGRGEAQAARLTPERSAARGQFVDLAAAVERILTELR